MALGLTPGPLLLSSTVGGPPSQRLFELLPERLFSPLASTNRRQYWTLLCVLHERRFGPDAPVPPSTGFPLRDIVSDIEQELRHLDWVDEEANDGAATDASAEVNWTLRAFNTFNRLKDAGWLRIERYGVREMVSMRPTVAQFLSQLIAFAEKGPVFLRGKVRSIDLNLQQLLSGQATGDTLAEAAEQARRLLEHVASASTNVRDLIDSFGADIATADFVRQFCAAYIERFFIGDYSELKNAQDHPLAKQAAILDAAIEIRQVDGHRRRLLEWYETKRVPEDKARALKLFERDIDRILELNRLEEHLRRLDEEVRRANRKATAFLDYRIRSPRPVEATVRQAIARVLAHPAALATAPFGMGGLMSEERIRDPKKAADRTPTTPLRRVAPTAEAIAARDLRMRAAERRRLSGVKVAAYLSRHLQTGVDGAERAGFDGLTIDSVEDLCVVQFLMAKANEARRGPVRHMFMRGVEFEVDELADRDAGEVSNGYVTSKAFSVRRRPRPAATPPTKPWSQR